MKIRQIVILLAVIAALIFSFYPLIISLVVFVGSLFLNVHLAYVPHPECHGDGG